jgi:hypothetical protein
MDGLTDTTSITRSQNTFGAEKASELPPVSMNYANFSFEISFTAAQANAVTRTAVTTELHAYKK